MLRLRSRDCLIQKKIQKKFKNQILSDSLMIPDETGTSQEDEKEIEERVP